MSSLQNAPTFYNPTVKTWQGQSSATFKRPDFDTELTVPQLFEFHAKNSPNHEVFAYVDDDKREHAIHFPEVYRGIQKSATMVSEHYNRLSDYYAKAQDGKSELEPPVIGILASTDNISFFTFKVGIMYLGLTPFPISIRNSAVAVAHLVTKTGVKQIFVSGDAAMQRLAREANEILAKDGLDFEVLPMPVFEDIYGPGGDENLVPMHPNLTPERKCIILHSSGSTAFPKPIRFMDKTLRQWGTFVYFGDVDFCNVRVSGQPNPMFHIMGTLMIAWTIYDGMTWTMFKPTTPPVLPTPEAFLDSLIATRTEIVYCVPAFVEAWAQIPENMAKIKTLRAIIYAGAPMNKQIGDRIAAEDIALIPFYGLTEIGAVVRLIPDPKTMDKPEWDYFQISPHIDLRLIPQEGRPGLYEPVAFESPYNTPNVFNAVIDGRPAYATSDLLQQHPTKPHLFRVFGRVDDQLMLSTGEKTNPAPLEAILMEDPNVYACLMFGRGRFQNGVLIQPEEPFDPSDEAALEAYRNKIWPSIEKMNAYAPSHSRIFKEMIMVTKPEKPLEYTAKGTPRRQVCINAYSEEIEALYKLVEESSQVDVTPPQDWSPEAVHTYVGELVKKVMKNPTIKDTDDLFQQGCDSLQATWIRNTTIHALRSSSNINIHDIPPNFVYTNHTISALSAYISGLFSGKTLDKDAERAAGIERMREFLEKYGQGLERRFPEKLTNGDAAQNGDAKATAVSETVLVTGTTGRLGSHLLAQLLEREDVIRVYALNRESSGSVEKLEQRSREAFKQWSLDESLLNSGKVSFHAVDLAKSYFGLGESLYEELRTSVTQIIHNAWRVDFNVALPSFEPLLAGARNLIDFALNSSVPGGPRALFVSSISSMRNHVDPTPAEETIDTEPDMAYGGGYPESKWVTEQLFARAARQAGLRTTSVRVGQVSGDQRTGGWNTTEWVAALVRVSQRLGCIPLKDEEITWTAVDVVAATLQEMVYSNELALHLINPKPVPWNSIFEPIAERLGVPAVPYEQWLEHLEKAATQASKGPGVEQHEAAYNLVTFFKTAGMGGSKGPLSTAKAVRVSKSLANVKPLDREDALHYVEFWVKVDHLKL